MTSNPIAEETRQQIATFLPEAIEKTLISYQDFMEQSNVDGEVKAKIFSDHHSACKAAISHLELLLKLARWADVPQGGSNESQRLEHMLLEAQERIKKYNESDKFS